MIKSGTELWKTWPENTKIEVSSFGHVCSTDGHYYSSWPNHGGYLQVTFRMNGKCIHRKVHRMVAETFIPNPNNLPEINHKDNDRTNNCVSNLEWCTRSYNREYKEIFGKAQNRPVFAINLSTLKVFWFQSQSKASRVLRISVGSISNIIKGRYKQINRFWFVDADNNAVNYASSRLHKLIGNKINNLTAGDDSKKVFEFITGLKLK